LIATWKIHVNDSNHSHGHLSSAFSRVARRASASLTRRRRLVYQKQQSIDAAAASSPASGAVDALGQADRERKDSIDSAIIYNGWLRLMFSAGNCRIRSILTHLSCGFSDNKRVKGKKAKGK